MRSIFDEFMQLNDIPKEAKGYENLYHRLLESGITQKEAKIFIEKFKYMLKIYNIGISEYIIIKALYS